MASTSLTTAVIILLSMTADILTEVETNRVAAKAECAKKDINKNLAMELKDSLFCGYDASVHPVKNETIPLEVEVALIVTRVGTGDELTGVPNRVYIHAWILMEWRDENLNWRNISKYEEIKMILVPSVKLWKPNVILLTSDSTYSSKEAEATCGLKNTGKVVCVMSDIFSIDCLVDHKYWPLGTMKCTMIMSAWTQSHRIILVHAFNDSSIGLMEPEIHERHHHWQLISWQSNNIVLEGPINETFPSVLFILILDRYTTTKFVFVTGPIIVTVSLMLVSYVLDIVSTERIVILVTSLLCHFLCTLQFMHSIPVNGDTCPVIVLFLRGSTVLTIMAILQTLILGIIRKLNCNTVQIIEKILESRFGRILTYGSPEITDSILCDTEENKDHTKKWKLFVLFLNRLFLMVAAFVYSGLCLSLFI